MYSYAEQIVGAAHAYTVVNVNSTLQPFYLISLHRGYMVVFITTLKLQRNKHNNSIKCFEGMLSFSFLLISHSLIHNCDEKIYRLET